jgi:ribulose-phosphate 3-epimerase
VKLAPSVLSCDFGHLAEEIAAVEAGGADWIHIDVMDGHFVPNITIGPLIVEAARRATKLTLDVHLMIESPERYVGAFIDAGADVVTVHQEACPHLHRTLQTIRELGARAGVALNPATPVEAVRDVVGHLDLLLIMSVNPGFGGQRFISETLEKLPRARALLGAAHSAAELEVDGGVDASNAASIVSAGASVLVAGSAVYGHPEGPAAGIARLRDTVRR